MALCCIGGVCVPYTAIVPVLLLVLKWLASKLAALGLLPDSVMKALGVSAASNDKSICSSSSDGKSCSKSIKAAAVPSAPTTVQIVHEDNEDLVQTLVTQKKETVVLKFTATWCRPCQAIAPVYAELCTQYAAHFLEVDVDDCDAIAAQYKVAVMPTFCIVTAGGLSVETMTGSNAANLTSFMDAHLTKRINDDSGKLRGA
mmetsp:Transcript_17164/g.28514  ORF Transcript_17164/g.28514 Transcript_17164/m.28514 type:complete len:201 (+) Transcript_17164:74-676(+)|eukprot:CAMPEP_0119002792 /NCGR_PEP_ID=MMETSP1176-20130426/130_1 /TAXON_ID=265551 /ORGANISM="Synedropsis recta cf, Strain CCMP1620" /LENGTH=200 /DNA_ID=CAMNT_0006954317 /DNA_START=69 /DNA_END=671 /DNA_ORIENTATION=-